MNSEIMIFPVYELLKKKTFENTWKLTNLVKEIDEIVVTNKIFEKYCTTIVIIFMSVPTTYVSLVLSDLFWAIIVVKI